jgi:hypothetical protein
MNNNDYTLSKVCQAVTAATGHPAYVTTDNSHGKFLVSEGSSNNGCFHTEVGVNLYNNTFCPGANLEAIPGMPSLPSCPDGELVFSETGHFSVNTIEQIPDYLLCQGHLSDGELKALFELDVFYWGQRNLNGDVFLSGINMVNTWGNWNSRKALNPVDDGAYLDADDSGASMTVIEPSSALRVVLPYGDNDREVKLSSVFINSKALSVLQFLLNYCPNWCWVGVTPIPDTPTTTIVGLTKTGSVAFYVKTTNELPEGKDFLEEDTLNLVLKLDKPGKSIKAKPWLKYIKSSFRDNPVAIPVPEFHGRYTSPIYLSLLSKLMQRARTHEIAVDQSKAEMTNIICLAGTPSTRKGKLPSLPWTAAICPCKYESGTDNNHD